MIIRDCFIALYTEKCWCSVGMTIKAPSDSYLGHRNKEQHKACSIWGVFGGLGSFWHFSAIDL